MNVMSTFALLDYVNEEQEDYAAKEHDYCLEMSRDIHNYFGPGFNCIEVETERNILHTNDTITRPSDESPPSPEVAIG